MTKVLNIVRAPSPARIETTVHITHVKAGSTWIDRILRKAFPTLTTPRGKIAADQAGLPLDQYVFPSGKIIPALFINRQQFLGHPELSDSRRFVMIRDLRDTVVSLYFSYLKSHPLFGDVAETRQRLQAMSQEEGLLFCVRERTRVTANLQLSWIDSGERVVRYEDAIQNDVAILTELFLDHLKLPISPAALKKVIHDNSFQARFGRPLGTEDTTSHGRQGAPGNWRRYFTPRVAEEFRREFAQVLIQTGYERDEAWVQEARGLAAPELIERAA
jgi:lipopolysaccharide transport system ATP-binding protein